MDVLLKNLDLYGPGFLTTVELFLWAAAVSLLLGTILAVLRVSPVPILRGAATVYVTLMINTPLTLLFLFFAFGFPVLAIANLSPFWGAIAALSPYTSAFVCEAVRSGINTVSVGQVEASRALGLTFGQMLSVVVLPQAIRSVVPPLMNQMNALLKNTTIAAGFSVVEAGAIQSYLSERGYNVLVGLLWVALFFVLLVVPLTLLQHGLEKRWSIAR